MKIQAREASDQGTALAAVRKGLDQVQRCGAPIRAFLLNLLRNCYSKEGGPNLNDLKALVYRTG